MPLNPESGVYVTPLDVALMTAVPFDGIVTPVIVSVSPSASVSFARTSILTLALKDVIAESSFATGGVLPIVTVLLNENEEAICPKTEIRWFSLSATRISPKKSSTTTPWGSWNSPSPVPVKPNSKRKVSLVSSTCTRSLNKSATITLPNIGSKATP